MCNDYLSSLCIWAIVVYVFKWPSTNSCTARDQHSNTCPAPFAPALHLGIIRWFKQIWNQIARNPLVLWDISWLFSRFSLRTWQWNSKVVQGSSCSFSWLSTYSNSPKNVKIWKHVKGSKFQFGRFEWLVIGDRWTPQNYVQIVGVTWRDVTQRVVARWPWSWN